MSTEPRTDLAAAPSAEPATVGGLRKKTLAIVGVVTAGVWAFAISTGSVVFMAIVGALTALLAGLLFWAIRMGTKQRKLMSLLQGAGSSPEARRAALAKLGEGKDAGDITHVFARAQLEAGEDPVRALATLEALDWKKIPAQMQDDVAILQSQLYLQFGRPKDARRLVDQINVDSSQRKQLRGLMVAVVAESWGRTGRHQDAIKLLDSVKFEAEKDEQVRIQLRIARTFARFAAGKKGEAREDLNALADADLNYLGKFLMPQFRVHPELQKLARKVAERHPDVARRVAVSGQQRRGRPR